jgi:hypothetical protein
VPLHTATSSQQEVGCLAARISGYLVADATYGLALADSRGGHGYGVIWPNGYSARRDGDRLVLLDRSGTVVAREGQLIEMAGYSHLEGGIARPCYNPSLRVTN